MLDVRCYDVSCFMRGETPAQYFNPDAAHTLRSRFSGVTVPALGGKMRIIFILLLAKFVIYYVATGPASGDTRRVETAKFIF